MTIIYRRSQLTGCIHSMDIPVTEERVIAYLTRTDPRLVQEAFPELDADQREFIMTGITPAEWASVFGTEEEEPEHNWSAPQVEEEEEWEHPGCAVCGMPDCDNFV